MTIGDGFRWTKAERKGRAYVERQFGQIGRVETGLFLQEVVDALGREVP